MRASDTIPRSHGKASRCSSIHMGKHSTGIPVIITPDSSMYLYLHAVTFQLLLQLEASLGKKHALQGITSEHFWKILNIFII